MKSARTAPALVKKPSQGVYAYATDEMAWSDLPRTGVKEKAVRSDAGTGHYLGLIAFEPLSRSGLHQHLGTALSYFLAGSLTDYQGTAAAGIAGINHKGATHDAVSYAGCLLASRLEGPVVSADSDVAAHPLRGTIRGPLRNPEPLRWPDLNIPVEPLPLMPTPFPRIGRRMIFDYARTGDNRRFVALTLMPHAPRIEIEHSGLTDWYVLAGDVKVAGRRAVAGPFFVIEPAMRVVIESDFGGNVLCWAEGPAWGESNGERADLYGF